MDEKYDEVHQAELTAVAALSEVIDQSKSQDVSTNVPRKPIPKTSKARQQASVAEEPLDLRELLAQSNSTQQRKETVLYLGYGSNLAAETFLGRRGIAPLSQVNIVVPELQLAFNLPGIPYKEPCFANSRRRHPNETTHFCTKEGYHKNAWKKGLVGVVYEVTKADYAHIIATEGGGSGYQDIVVDCYVLDDNPTAEVPEEPKGTPFKAHTLYADSGASTRRDPDYAQPSARYLKLITDGASEHDLPLEYREYLLNIRSFHITTTRQKLGMMAFMLLWGPVFFFIFRGPAKVFLNPDGTYPEWFKRLTRAIFAGCWSSYDRFFKPTFGEGERTIGQDVHKKVMTDEPSQRSEKDPLLPVYSKTIHTEVQFREA